jgi:hypothetical protein
MLQSPRQAFAERPCGTAPIRVEVVVPMPHVLTASGPRLRSKRFRYTSFFGRGFVLRCVRSIDR